MFIERRITRTYELGNRGRCLAQAPHIFNGRRINAEETAAGSSEEWNAIGDALLCKRIECMGRGDDLGLCDTHKYFSIKIPLQEFYLRN